MTKEKSKVCVSAHMPMDRPFAQIKIALPQLVYFWHDNFGKNMKILFKPLNMYSLNFAGKLMNVGV